jgi:hypothetical protein
VTAVPAVTPPRLFCPPIGPRDLEGAVPSLDHGLIQALSRRYPTLASSFGLELKAAWAAERSGAVGEVGG